MDGTRVCEVCGEHVAPGVEFCTSCGAYLGWSEPPADAPAPPPPARPSTASAPPPPPLQHAPAAQPPLPPSRPPAHGPSGYGPSGYGPPAGAATAAPPLLDPQLRCPTCGTGNESTLRFCRKCGTFIGTPTRGDRPVVTVVRRRWWQRWFTRRPASERVARRSYRRSLPLLVRLRRVFAVLLAVVVAGVLLKVAGHDPITWARKQLDNLRGTLVAASGVGAQTDPASKQLAGFGARLAVDGRADTAWSSTLTGRDQPTGPPCSASAAPSALVLTARSQLTVRAIRVQPGLAATDSDRLKQPRPKVLDLGFSDGSCQRVVVSDDPGPQTIDLHPVSTAAVRVMIVAGYAPQGGSTSTQVSITQIDLMTRPN